MVDEHGAIHKNELALSEGNGTRLDVFEKYEEIKRRVCRCLQQQEGQSAAIADKWFRGVRWDVRLLYEQYGFGEKNVLDIGCAYGSSLFMWGEQSEGVELHGDCVSLLETLGRKVHTFNVEDGIWPSIPERSFEAVFSSNLIEHLVAPHLFFANVFRVLEEDGIFALQHPVVVPHFVSRLMRVIPQLGMILGREGWQAGEHINFFTPRTIRLSLERAGFVVVAQYGGYFRRLPGLGKKIVPVVTKCLSVCQKNPAHSYSRKRVETFDPEWARDLLCQYRPHELQRQSSRHGGIGDETSDVIKSC